MTGLLIVLCSLLGGVIILLIAFLWKIRNKDKSKMRSITRILFVSTHICALIWVFISYGIALYSTLVLKQVYTMAELSEPAINTVLGTSALKVLENIFEHNQGGLWGKSDKDDAA